MNRIIKFRVWDKQNNEMVQWKDVRETELLDDAFDGKDAVAMQFTGLKDKNNIDIYEGDVIKFSSLNYEVVWNGIELRWHMQCPYYRTYKRMAVEFLSSNMGGCFEIIGNVFQNPELLNAKTN